jgi:hypothetical protein
MSDSNELEKTVRDIIVGVCGVLYKHGFQTVSLGAVMRLVGVDQEVAAQHDEEQFVLDDDFRTLWVQLDFGQQGNQVPPGTTLH